MSKTISVVIPTHPGREKLLERALASVHAQTVQPDEIIVELDKHGHGAAITRQAGLDKAIGGLVAFLDSDDEMMPEHLATLREPFLHDPTVIMTFSWFEAVGQPDPFRTGDGRSFLGLPFDIYHPHHTTVTTMVSRWAARAVDGFPLGGEGSTPGCLNEDWIFLLRMCEYARDYDQKILHIPRRTWRWHNGHGGNTSGRPGRGDA